MKNIPVVQILRVLGKEKMKSLEKYMLSPFCVTHEQTGALFIYLKNHLDDDPSLTREQAAVALGVEPTRVYHLTNYLLEAVERFLAHQEWEKDPALQNRQAITALRQMKLGEVTDNMSRYARRRLEGQQWRGAAFYKADFELRQEAFLASQQQGRAKKFNLQEISDAQDISFMAERLRTGCLVASHQSVARQEYDNGLLQLLLQFLEGHRYLEIPIIGGYYHGYYAMSGAAGEESEGHFHQLKKILEEYGHQFSQAEVQDLYLMAINFCIRRFNQANQIYIKDAFDLYRSGLLQGALLENGTLSRWTYNNITLTALHLKEFEWAATFLNEYSVLLPIAHREGAFHLNMARYHYERRDLRTAMQHLLHREHDDVLQNLAAKALLSRIYWELDEEEALDNQIDSIHIYLRRQKILGYHRDIYAAFVKVMRKLLKINRNDRNLMAKFREEIAAIPALAERDWLLRQLEK